MVKSTVGRQKSSAVSYPKLKISTVSIGDLVVLFTEPETGTVVVPDRNNPIGRWSQTWIEQNFKDFHGTVTLSNEVDDD